MAKFKRDINISVSDMMDEMSATNRGIEVKTKESVKSPLNYTGGKFKLLPQILPLFPKDIDCFVDLFGGGFNVGSNVEAKHVIYNEFDERIFNLVKYLCTEDPHLSYSKIMSFIEKYNLTKENKDGYLTLREDYNSSEHKDWSMLYTLIAYAFNNQIRFNKSGGYNMPFGKGRSSFNESLQKKFKLFTQSLCKRNNIEFHNNCFSYISSLNLDSEDLVYCDPPYLVTMASYNEADGWNEVKERELLDQLDYLNKNNVRFALSNVLENKGKSNDILKEWSEKYNIHYLNHTYANCSYHAKDRSKNTTIEVLITNYDAEDFSAKESLFS